MCFYSKLSQDALKIANRFKAQFIDAEEYNTAEMINGFSFPKTPIVKDKFCDVANCTAKGPYTQAELDAHNANPGAAHPAVNPKDKTCDHPGCTAPGPYTQAELDAHKANPGAAHPPVDPKDKTCDHPGCTAPGPYTQAELDAHKANPGAAHPAPPPSFICNVCSPAVPFASQAELDAHNTATHPAP